MPTRSCCSSATPNRPAARAGPTAHLGDRDSLDLVGQQNDLFDALHALGKPLVAVLVNGRPPATVTIAGQANAMIEAWYAGEQQGNAMADVLFGDVNPGGKLPVTVPRSVGQLPMFYNYKPSAHRGYLFSDSADRSTRSASGLSYTTLRPRRTAPVGGDNPRRRRRDTCASR